MRGEGAARRKTKKTKKLLKFYSDRYPDLARVCAEQMFKKQTLRTFSLRDSHNLQHGLCSFIAACENTRIQVFFRLGVKEEYVFSLHVQPVSRRYSKKIQTLLESQLMSFNLLLDSSEKAKKMFSFAEADTDSEGNEFKRKNVRK